MEGVRIEHIGRSGVVLLGLFCHDASCGLDGAVDLVSVLYPLGHLVDLLGATFLSDRFQWVTCWFLFDQVLDLGEVRCAVIARFSLFRFLIVLIFVGIFIFALILVLAATYGLDLGSDKQASCINIKLVVFIVIAVVFQL